MPKKGATETRLATAYPAKEKQTQKSAVRSAMASASSDAFLRSILRER